MTSVHEVRQGLLITDWKRKMESEPAGIIQAEELAAIRSVDVMCLACKKSSALHRYTFIQRLYYVRPSGCTEGDYWGNCDTEVCELKCPECGHKNYIYNHPVRDLIVPMIKRILEQHQLFDAPIIRKEA